MNQKKIEVFSAGCCLCDETVELVRNMACPSCAVEILDMRKAEVAERAKQLGVARVPAVVIDGKLVSCCAGTGPDKDELGKAGLGKP